jgi:polyhydroxybutyrate depolymerase
MGSRRGILWPIGVTCGLFLVSLVGAAAVRKLALGDTPPAGNKPGTIEVGGRTRDYFVHVPPSYDGQTAVPVVLVLHGATESPENVERLSGMSAKADKENFLAVYPRGTGRQERALMPTWNAGECCAYAMENHVDDVAFLSALVDEIEQDYNVDAKRIFVTGISNGGMMSYRLACELSDKIAAIAPVEGAQDVPCHPANRVSVMVFHGTADHLVPFDGGSTPFQLGSKRSDASVADTVAFWVKQDGCSPAPQRDETAAVHTDLYSGCKDGTSVALYAIQGGHHMWPGVRLSGNSVPATDLMWDFFSKHPKP